MCINKVNNNEEQVSLYYWSLITYDTGHYASRHQRWIDSCLDQVAQKAVSRSCYPGPAANDINMWFLLVPKRPFTSH